MSLFRISGNAQAIRSIAVLPAVEESRTNPRQLVQERRKTVIKTVFGRFWRIWGYSLLITLIFNTRAVLVDLKVILDLCLASFIVPVAVVMTSCRSPVFRFIYVAMIVHLRISRILNHVTFSRYK